MYDEKYLQWSLHTSCPLRPRVKDRPQPPGLRAYPVGDAIGLSFQSAIRRLPVHLREPLTEAARAVVERVPRRTARAFLNAATAPGATREYFADGVRMITARGFASLARPLQDFAIQTWQRLVALPALRAILIATIDERMFEGAPLEDGLQWLRYLAGPSSGPHNEPKHAALLGAFWSERTRELRAVLGAPREILPAILQQFFHQPCRPIHVLRKGRRAPAIIVFGDPRAPRSLSYAHSLVRSEGAAEAWVQSPDPRVACAWNDRVPYKTATFLCRSALLTRLEELSMINWIENNHVISEQGGYWPRALPFGVFAGCLRLDATVESIADRFASLRGGAGFETSRFSGASKA